MPTILMFGGSFFSVSTKACSRVSETNCRVSRPAARPRPRRRANRQGPRHHRHLFGIRIERRVVGPGLTLLPMVMTGCRPRRLLQHRDDGILVERVDQDRANLLIDEVLDDPDRLSRCLGALPGDPDAVILGRDIAGLLHPHEEGLLQVDRGKTEHRFVGPGRDGKAGQHACGEFSFHGLSIRFSSVEQTSPVQARGCLLGWAPSQVAVCRVTSHAVGAGAADQAGDAAAGGRYDGAAIRAASEAAPLRSAAMPHRTRAAPPPSACRNPQSARPHRHWRERGRRRPRRCARTPSSRPWS